MPPSPVSFYGARARKHVTPCSIAPKEPRGEQTSTVSPVSAYAGDHTTRLVPHIAYHLNEQQNGHGWLTSAHELHGSELSATKFVSSRQRMCAAFWPQIDFHYGAPLDQDGRTVYTTGLFAHPSIKRDGPASAQGRQRRKLARQNEQAPSERRLPRNRLMPTVDS